MFDKYIGNKLNTIKIDKENGKTLQKSSLVDRQLPNEYMATELLQLFLVAISSFRCHSCEFF
jgi:hypothetical protein